MKQWVLREKIPEGISKELNVKPDIVRQFLFNKGIKTSREAEIFLNPDYKKDPHDPFKMSGMRKAVKRIIDAVEKNERIVVFGDYDADGICASVIFHDFFKKIGFENFHVHIPDRHLDGYGLTLPAVDEFVKQKASVLITLDCGITNFDEINKANGAGIDVVVIDHHLVPEKIPDASAVVDPKQQDDKYPFKFLCGAGLAFKTVCAIIQKGKFNIMPGWEKWLLDIVAIATVADMVSLTGENRILVFYGLKVLQKTQRPGLLSFYKRFGVNAQNINEDDISFVIAPRINVASRIDHATISFDLLTTQSVGEAAWINERLDIMNNERKTSVGEIVAVIDKNEECVSKDVIVTGDTDWHPGVLGLAANKLLEKHNRPVFLWGKGAAKEIKGSCRSDGSINLVEFMGKLPENILSEFGGHALAGGFSMGKEGAERFKNEVLALYKKFPKQKVENNILYIDGKLSVDDINWDFYSLIEKFQPFGVENPRLVFEFCGLEVAGVRKFGNGGIHLQLDFKKNEGGVVSAIGFFMAKDEWFDLRPGQRVDLAASLEKNCFRGNTELRLRIIDIKLE